MPYAIVAPGLSLVSDDYQDVERIKTLYPYPKFRKFKTEQECVRYISYHENKHSFDSIVRYGDIFDTVYVKMEYYIGEDFIGYNFDISHFGYTRLYSDKAKIVQHGNIITATLENIKVPRDTILGNLAAIYNGLYLLGTYVDVEVVIRNHAMFYALTVYNGSNAYLSRAIDKIKNRLGGLAITLRLPKGIKEEVNEEYD